ncbi:MAG TPA: hypothetical protein PLB96_07580, partial [Syntrophales bacterium]|nr:hypothetical protein [Syntrophales bacterium]
SFLRCEASATSSRMIDLSQISVPYFFVLIQKNFHQDRHDQAHDPEGQIGIGQKDLNSPSSMGTICSGLTTIFPDV